VVTAKWRAKRVYVSLSALILAALRDVPRATVPKIAEDIGKDKSAVYRHLRGLLQIGLIEEAGDIETRNNFGRVIPTKTYRIHSSMRAQP
jgi:DNA-binding MarR family transcriptional regulator